MSADPWPGIPNPMYAESVAGFSPYEWRNSPARNRKRNAPKLASRLLFEKSMTTPDAEVVIHGMRGKTGALRYALRDERSIEVHGVL